MPCYQKPLLQRQNAIVGVDLTVLLQAETSHKEQFIGNNRYSLLHLSVTKDIPRGGTGGRQRWGTGKDTWPASPELLDNAVLLPSCLSAH